MVSVIEREDRGGGRMITRTRPAHAVRRPLGAVAKHRAGSLEAAVAAVRKRNLVLSSGILLLLTMAVGLIVVSARRAQELARQQMEFVAAVSHELRTPVSVIGAAAGNLADGVVGDPQRVRKYGETIQGEARRLAETVERVLQLAGIAAGQRRRGSGADRSGGSRQRFARRLPRRDRGRRRQGRSRRRRRPADVLGDVTALRSALQNLISNAVKYGGDATLASRHGAGRREPRVGEPDSVRLHRRRPRAWASTPTIASTFSSRSIAAAKPSRNRSRAAASA